MSVWQYGNGGGAYRIGVHQLLCSLTEQEPGWSFFRLVSVLLGWKRFKVRRRPIRCSVWISSVASGFDKRIDIRDSGASSVLASLQLE